MYYYFLMQMIQRSFFIEKNLYLRVAELARQQEVPTAQLLRSFIKTGVKRVVVKKRDATKFLLDLASYHLTGGPKDLAKHHDRYAWE